MKKLKSSLLWFGIALLIVLGGCCSATVHAEALTNYAENQIVDGLLRGQPIGTPATFHIGLSTDICNDTGSMAEPSGNGYARIAVASSLDNWSGTQSAGSTTASIGTDGLTSNNNAIAFDETTGAWGNLRSVLWYDASSGGNAWICVNLTSPLDVAGAGFTIRFQPGQLQFQIDN